MNKTTINDILYGALVEIANDSDLYYHSTVGSVYSKLTDKGKEEVLEFIEIMLAKIRMNHQAELDRRAKEMVIKGLKG